MTSLTFKGDCPCPSCKPSVKGDAVTREDTDASCMVGITSPATPCKCTGLALEIALNALRTLHRNGISDEIAGTALNDIQEIMECK